MKWNIFDGPIIILNIILLGMGFVKHKIVVNGVTIKYERYAK